MPSSTHTYSCRPGISTTVQLEGTIPRSNLDLQPVSNLLFKEAAAWHSLLPRGAVQYLTVISTACCCCALAAKSMLVALLMARSFRA